MNLKGYYLGGIYPFFNKIFYIPGRVIQTGDQNRVPIISVQPVKAFGLKLKEIVSVFPLINDAH